MMTYHPNKFGHRKIIRSVDITEKVISDYMSPRKDLELEDSKPIFLHDTLANKDASASPYKLRL